MNKNKIVRVTASQKQLECAIKGGLKSAINAHGAILDRDNIESAIKRIYGQMKQYMELVHTRND